MTSPYHALVERALKTNEGMKDWLAYLRRAEQREDLFKDLQKDLRRKYGKNTTMAGPFCEELWLIVDKRLPRIMINQDGTIYNDNGNPVNTDNLALCGILDCDEW